MAILVLLSPAVDEKEEEFLLFSSALPLVPMKAERCYHTTLGRRSQSKASGSNPARLGRIGKL